MGVLLVVFTLAFLTVGGVRGQQTSQQTGQMTQCPDGWAKWQSFCYFFNNVSRVTWTQAGNECYDKLGHPLRLETDDEYEFVKKQLELHPSDSYWTALNDLAVNEPTNSNSTFMWGNDEMVSDVVTKHWDKEPNNTPFENCVGVDIQGACSVEDCAHRHAYICEIQKSTDELCPAFWDSLTYDSDLCYYVSNATSWPDVVDWREARKRCDSMAPFRNSPGRKARLLSITSQEVQTFLSSDLSLVFNGRQLFWTGLNDNGQEGNFTWADRTDTSVQSNYIIWRQEPNNLAGQEHCGVLQPSGMFGDRNCDDLNNYACRMSLPDNPALFNLGCGGWMRAGLKCVYIQNTPTHTWIEARNYCMSKGGDLFKVTSRDDNLWLGIQSGLRLSDYGYWIGLRVMGEGFMWADGSATDYTLLSWDREPHSYGHNGESQSCGVMGYDGNFASWSCFREKTGVICETAAKNQACLGQGWTLFNTSCYLLDTTLRTHGEASTFCQRSSYDGSGYLFALNTQGEKDWLVSSLAKLANGQMFYWSSLVDRNRGEWHWDRFEDDDPEATETLVTWSYEPNNWKGQESCVQLNLNGMLNDANCASATGFICQKMVPAPPTSPQP